ncbi:MAG: FISUMP domain-containing protein [Candidatus Pacebacteria bacterium]|nr:FISUMP domain-containing protein [Candidatus Paceibacterota bacterium]
MFIKKDSSRGVAAIISVVSLGSLIFIISLATAILTYWSVKNVDTNQKGLSAYYAAYSGIEDALLKLERNNDFSGEYYLTVNGSNDVSVIISNSGDRAIIYSTAVSGQIQKRIESVVDIDNVTGLITPVQTTEVTISSITTTTATITTTTTILEWSCGDDVTFTYKGVSVTYGTVESNGFCWMDRNLGASRVATAYDDSDAYGDLFQWGRLSDGHQNRTSGITTTLSDSDNPGHSKFIMSPWDPVDWRSPQNNNLWQGVNGINNPCPSGWRLPTSNEWNTERASWSQQNYNGAYASALKLTAAGGRYGGDGLLYNDGSDGCYWSSTVDGTDASNLFFDGSNAHLSSEYRADGFSVRCLRD